MKSDLQESCDVYSDDNSTIQEKKHKRKVKTPSQVQALENLYNEHKYPTESMKLHLAESLGLTEKQISGWFCHRRLKDKKLLQDDTNAHGRQDRSSGVIQDRGSGLRQDSCGSTKQGEHKHCDPREVESRRFIQEEFPGADITYELGRQNIQNHSGTDNTSSGRSSPLEDRYFHERKIPIAVVTSRNLTQKGNVVPIDVKGVQGRTGPSGYLKVKGQVENSAITSVKRQLGRHYREDGPPLGVEFEPLPPGAFESPTRDSDNEPDCTGEPILPHSSYRSRSKQPYSITGYQGFNSKMASHNSDLDESSYKMMHGSNNCLNYPVHQFSQNPTSDQCNSIRKNYLSMEMNEDFSAEAPIYDFRDNYETRAKYDGGRITKDPVSSHRLFPYGRKLTSKTREPRSSNYNDVSVKIGHIEHFVSSPSNLPLKGNGIIDLKVRGLNRSTIKEGERGAINDYGNPVRVAVHPADEIRVFKKGKDEFPLQNARKVSRGEITPWTNPLRRSVAEVPSSFSEDETGETCSSAD